MSLKRSKFFGDFLLVTALQIIWPGLAIGDQGAWSYHLVPETVTGENWHPEASLASNNSLPLPTASSGTNIGYLGIKRKPSAAEEVIFSVEGSLGELSCPASGCSLQISIDGGASINFLAEEYYEIAGGKSHRVKQSVRLKNSTSFTQKVANAKRISVMFNSKINGTATLNFSASQPLRFPANLKRLNG